MISNFFNKSVVVKKLSSGKVRRFTSTATVDAGIQKDSDSREYVGAGTEIRYIGFFDTTDPIAEGRKIIDNSSGVEYIVEEIDEQSNPITGTSYLRAVMRKDSSQQDGGANV